MFEEPDETVAVVLAWTAPVTIHSCRSDSTEPEFSEPNQKCHPFCCHACSGKGCQQRSNISNGLTPTHSETWTCGDTRVTSSGQTPLYHHHALVHVLKQTGVAKGCYEKKKEKKKQMCQLLKVEVSGVNTEPSGWAVLVNPQHAWLHPPCASGIWGPSENPQPI